VGETEKKIRMEAEKALGGVLFIDEFHGFDKGHSNGNIAKDAMNELTSIINDHRDDLCVILAGYTDAMKRTLDYDPGWERRYPFKIKFSDYSVDTLMQILERKIGRYGRILEEDAKPLVRRVIGFHKGQSMDSFGNGGYISDILMPALDAKRLNRDEDAVSYTVQDVKDAFPSIAAETITKQKIYRKMDRLLLQDLKVPYKMEELNETELVTKVKPAVMYITTDIGQGTGFLIHPDGYALTCYHVVRGAKHINARLQDESGYECEILYYDEAIDIALIKMDGAGLPYLPLAAKDRKITVPEGVLLAGFPMGLQTDGTFTVFTGKIATEKTKDSLGREIYYLNLEGKSGNSGSPVFSLKDGSVIGIFKGSLDKQSGPAKTEEINYMRPIGYFWDCFLK